MHWVLQRGVLKQVNFDLLIDALDRAASSYSVVGVRAGTTMIEPDVDPSGLVYVCGALKMASIAAERGWKPGSFLNENFEHDRWLDHLGSELLNAEAKTVTLRDLEIAGATFVRPVADSKAFDGRVFLPADFDRWRSEHDQLLDVAVLAAPSKRLLREYRLFIVDDKIVTGSLYMQGGRPFLSSDVDPEAVSYVQSVIEQWQPAEAFVVDVALTGTGYRVIEFNNINSSGFYHSSVDRYAGM